MFLRFAGGNLHWVFHPLPGIL